MAAPTIQFKRGLIANLPALRAGEPGFTTDRSDFFVGGSDGNKFFGSHRYWKREVDSTSAAELKLVDAAGNSGISLRSPVSAGVGVTYTLPASVTDGYYLKTNAFGVLEWASINANATFENATLSGTTTITNADIQGGTINGTTIGLTTAAAADFTTLSADSLNVSGIATVGSLSIGSTQVVSSAFQLQNIQSLDTVTTATIEAAVANAPNTFTDLQVTGISTFNGNVNLGSDSSDIITVKGTTTFEQPVVGTISTATALQTARNFSITGDVVATAVSFNGTGDVVLNATIQANSVALGDDTTGNYVSTVSGTANQIAVSGSGVETASVTLSLPNDVIVNTSLSAPTVKTATIQHSTGTEAITIGSNGNVGVSTNLTVSGNLNVLGSTTTVNTETLLVKDSLIEVGLVDSAGTLVPPSTDANIDVGMVFHYYDTTAKKAAVFWDDSAGRIKVASEVTEANKVLTTVANGSLEIGNLYVAGCAGSPVEVIGCVNGEVTITNAVIDGGSFV